MKELPYKVYSLNALKPEGWLKRQLEIQAAGLSGHLHELWPDVYDSKWVGGKAEGWERLTYWLDGYIPLAKLLGNEEMLAVAKKYIDAIIEKQEDDGWICPCATLDEKLNYDMWALFLLLKALIVWQDATGDERIEEVVYKALQSFDRLIDVSTLFDWAQTRWFECLIAIDWIYARRPESWLMDLAIKLQAQGFDWFSFYKRWPMAKPCERGRWSQMNHVVNNAMMLKSPALWYKVTGDKAILDETFLMVEQLDKYHGMVTGVFTGDENLAGLSPSQGTELCAVAEYMYSLQFLAATGEPCWGDRLERITYNALPATFSPDMWTHQYDQLVNQPIVDIIPEHSYTTNNADANVFGFEPNYGCCTANLSQAWPKFTQSLLMEADDGIAITAYAPVTLNTTVKGVKVKVTIETEYPFRDNVKVKVNAEKPVSFTIHTRIPKWAKGATVDSKPVSSGEYASIVREWSDDTISLIFPMQVDITARPENRVAAVRGPLVYSLKIGEEWALIPSEIPYHKPPHADYSIHPTTPYDYKLCADEPLTFTEKPLGDMPFSPDGAPVVCAAKGKREGEVEEITLIPYGCTNIRITEFDKV